MTNCELSLFTTLDNIIQDTSSPNKVFDSFAAGQPVIQTTRGWIYDLIEREKCGFNSDPQNPEHFALKIEEYFKLGRDQKDKMSEAAKRLSQTQFDRVELANKYIAIISNASN
jgi:glycosyltransferase involved in cell wall biosynthesis